MNENDFLQWLTAITHNTPMPGQYTPGTNPLDTLTGPPQ